MKRLCLLILTLAVWQPAVADDGVYYLDAGPLVKHELGALPMLPQDGTTCQIGDDFPCDIEYLAGQGNSFPFGGAQSNWYGFALKFAPSNALVSFEMRDADGVSRRFTFTPSGVEDLRRSVGSAQTWLAHRGAICNGAPCQAPSEITCPTCPTCEVCPDPVECPIDDSPPASSCIPFGVPCNPMTQVCCSNND